MGWRLKIIAGLLAFKVALLALGYVGLLIASPFLNIIKIFRIFGAMRAMGVVGGFATQFSKLAAGTAVVIKILKGLLWAVRGLVICRKNADSAKSH
ncbi:MAG: hypothetical protein LBF61_09440 [Azoarcus sp.]|nr:hypothetical protein [Azoarcus sp.]